MGIGAQIDTDGSARSVGNPITMALSGITQALNLKAAIEYNDGNGKDPGCILEICWKNLIPVG